MTVSRLILFPCYNNSIDLIIGYTLQDTTHALHLEQLHTEYIITGASAQMTTQLLHSTFYGCKHYYCILNYELSMFSDGCRLLASSEALELLWECCMKEEKKNLISCMQCAIECHA